MPNSQAIRPLNNSHLVKQQRESKMQSRTSATLEQHHTRQDVGHVNRAADASPRERLISSLSLPVHEIDPNRIRFQDDALGSGQGGFALVRRALLDPPTSAPRCAIQPAPRPVAVKILKVSKIPDPERLRKVLPVEFFILIYIHQARSPSAARSRGACLVLRQAPECSGGIRVSSGPIL